MKVKFENNRLQMLPDGLEEEQFVAVLARRMDDSNRLMSWFGDLEFDGEQTTGLIITWQPDKKPGEGIGAPKVA